MDLPLACGSDRGSSAGGVRASYSEYWGQCALAMALLIAFVPREAGRKLNKVVANRAESLGPCSPREIGIRHAGAELEPAKV